MPVVRGNYCFMAKYTDNLTIFMAVYFISTNDEALTTIYSFVQDLVMSLGLRLLHIRADSDSEFIADFSCDYCKNTAVIQQFSFPNTPKENDLSKGDGRTIMDVVRCMLNGAALPKCPWGKMPATAVFLLNRLPNKTIGGDTPYYKMFAKHADLSFLLAIGTHPQTVVKCILCYLRGTPDLDIIYIQTQQRF